MNCPKCGNPISDGVKYCGTFGANIDDIPLNKPIGPQKMGTRYRKWILVLVPVTVLLAVIVIVLIATRPHAHANTFPPYQSVGYTQQENDKGKEKYIVADLQLAGAMNEKKTSQTLAAVGAGNTVAGNALTVNAGNAVYRYYLEYLDDAVVSAAVNDFYYGDIVINIYQFDRVNLGDLGWQVVYGGTQTVANASDFVMASDISGLGSEEARVRYILADAQLGDVIGYYRQYLDQPAVQEAVDRWDAGVRVINIDQFERKIVGQAGWKVVYIGTDITINGMDVILSEEPGGLNLDYCQNSYWPIVEGGTWQYHRFNATIDNGDILTDTITIRQYNQFTYNMGGAVVSFYCQPAGIHVAGQSIQLPSNENLYPGYQIDANGIITSVSGYETVTVPAGTFDTIVVMFTLKSENRLLYTYYYAQGVGIVKEVDEDLHDTQELVGYDIPGVGAVVAATPEPEANVNYCENPYWPIVEGAYWVYAEDQGGGTIDQQYKLSIQDILTRDNTTLFTLVKEHTGGSGGSTDQIYICTQDGIFDSAGHFVLPFNQVFQNGATYSAAGMSVKAWLPQAITVPAGTYYPVNLCYEDFYVWCFAFAEGIGPVRGNFTAMDWTDNLVSYYIPIESATQGVQLEEGTGADVCNNPYWPIVEGATWSYQSDSAGNSDTVTWQVASLISNSDGSANFSIVHNGTVDSWTTDYYCDSSGIYQLIEGAQVLDLPPAQSLVEGYTWGQLLEYGKYIVRSNETVQVPAGIFDALKIQALWGEAEGTRHFANGIGLVQQWQDSSSGESSLQLVSYNIPTSSIATATLTGYIAYPSEGWCPEIGLYARNTGTNEETYVHWNDGRCAFTIQVPAPGNYILYAYSLDPAYPFGFLYSNDCVNAISFEVDAGSNIQNLALGFCPGGNIPAPLR